MATKALLAGVNVYANAKFNLRGCVNDIESLSRVLTTTYGFAGDGITRLVDGAATRANILTQLDAMLSSARGGDTVVFAFSGHGTQVPSTEPGEDDIKDECLVPHEGTFTSLIKDNELFALFGKYITPDIKFTAIYDCCHSGTMLRDVMLDEHGEMVEDVINRLIDLYDLPALRQRGYQAGPYNVLSACRDEETAADLREAGPEKMPRGAFSFALHNFLRANPGVPLALAEPQILAAIQAASKHVQNPNYVLIDQNAPLIRY
jgi:hypothetical protein